MSAQKPIIGILALQGCVDRHCAHIEAAGADFCAVKTPSDFETVDAFILPGGESTTMLKLIERFGLWDTLAAEFAQKPVWGICAGTILMAQSVTNPAQKSFNLLPITVERNFYGRQRESQITEVEGYEVSFIRAPVITDAGSATIKSTYQDHPVWIKQGKYMATTFHPELTFNTPSPMHQAFIDLVQESS